MHAWIRPRLSPAQRARFDDLHKVFVISAGRTGTNFFGVQLGKLLPGCFSVHEPDRVDPADLADFLPKLGVQGPWRLLIGKALGLYGTRNLSLLRIEGRLDRTRALERLLAERDWVLSRASEAYAEANPQLFGLGADLAGLPNARVALCVRDPRTWVPSWMGKRWFAPDDWPGRIGWLGLRRLDPAIVGEPDPHWPRRSPLEKLCWTWRAMNQRFTDALAAGRDNLALFRYEDLFVRRAPQVLDAFIGLISHRGDRAAQVAELARLLSERINPRKAEGPRLFEDWSRQEQDVLLSHCAPLARRLGYEL